MADFAETSSSESEKLIPPWTTVSGPGHQLELCACVDGLLRGVHVLNSRVGGREDATH